MSFLSYSEWMFVVSLSLPRNLSWSRFSLLQLQDESRNFRNDPIISMTTDQKEQSKFDISVQSKTSLLCLTYLLSFLGSTSLSRLSRFFLLYLTHLSTFHRCAYLYTWIHVNAYWHIYGRCRHVHKSARARWHRHPKPVKGRLSNRLSKEYSCQNWRDIIPGDEDRLQRSLRGNTMEKDKHQEEREYDVRGERQGAAWVKSNTGRKTEKMWRREGNGEKRGWKKRKKIGDLKRKD